MSLAILFFTWFFVWLAQSMHAKNQMKYFSTDSVMSTLNKKTGMPEPGTYKLEKIFAAPTRNVLDTNGKLQPISHYTKGKITLLTFFYERCADAKGCPYAMNVFHTVKSKLEKNKENDDLIRLVHISFDPERDTPMMMKGLEKQMKTSNANAIEWNFLTTSSVNDLMPLIDGFGQNVDVNLDPNTGSPTLTYQHVLKVFLIDREGFVREIYSTTYLNADILLNDIKTLQMEKILYIRLIVKLINSEKNNFSGTCGLRNRPIYIQSWG